MDTATPRPIEPLPTEQPLLLDQGCPPLPLDRSVLLPQLAAGCSYLTADSPQALMTLCRWTDAPLAGRLTPMGLEVEPFGDLPYLDLVALYAERAFRFREAGASLLLLESFSTLEEARAALLGCRQSGLPVAVVFAVEEDGLLREDRDLLACVIVLQALGAAAVGFRCQGDRIDTLQVLGRIAPYATIPLLVRLDAVGRTEEHPEGFQLSPDSMAEYATQLLRAGAGHLAAGAGVGPDHLAVLHSAIESFDPADCVIHKDRETILMACSHQPFFLSPEHLELSSSIRCSWDMSDDIISAEEEGGDLLAVHVSSREDGISLGHNSHMIRLPICITADSEEALEYALLHYHGRAFVDALSDLDPQRLAQLAAGYGALVL